MVLCVILIYLTLGVAIASKPVTVMFQKCKKAGQITSISFYKLYKELKADHNSEYDFKRNSNIRNFKRATRRKFVLNVTSKEIPATRPSSPGALTKVHERFACTIADWVRRFDVIAFFRYARYLRGLGQIF